MHIAYYDDTYAQCKLHYKKVDCIVRMMYNSHYNIE